MDGWMDTPQTVITTRAPAVLTSNILQCDKKKQINVDKSDRTLSQPWH